MGVRTRYSPRLIASISAAFCLGASFPALAEEAESLDTFVNEFFLGSAVSTQEPYELQTTLAFSLDREDERIRYEPVAIVEFGLTKSLQIEVEAPLPIEAPLRGATSAGLGNVEVGFFHNAARDSERAISIALGMGLEFPASSAAIGERTFALTPLLVAYKRLGPLQINASVEAEIGLINIDDDEPERAALNGVVSVYTTLGRFAPTLELGVFYEDEQTSFGLAPGLLWHPVSSVEIGGAFVYRAGGDDASLGGALTATMEFDLGDEEQGEGDERRAEARPRRGVR